MHSLNTNYYSNNATTRNAADFNHKKNNIVFQGITRLIQDSARQKRPWISPYLFKEIYGLSNGKVIGKPTQDFLNLISDRPRDMLKFMDEFAEALKNHGKCKEKLELTFSPTGNNLKCQFIGSGFYGKVFKVDIQDNSYALKVYNYEDIKNYHGKHAEINTFAHFSGKDYKDLVKFYFGNPQAGWAISEFIPKDIASQTRQGEFLRRRNDVIFGDNRKENSIKGIIVDPGGMRPKNDIPILKSCDQKSTSMDPALLRSHPKEYSKDEYDEAMKYPESRVEASLKIRYLPEKFRKQAFDKAMEYPELRENAAFQIYWLPEDPIELRKAAYYKAMKYPESRPNAAFQIRYIAQEFQKRAYYEAMEYPESRANATSQIDFLPSKFQIKAYDEAMKYPESRKYLYSKADEFDENIGKKLFLYEIKDLKNSGQLNCIQDIKYVQ